MDIKQNIVNALRAAGKTQLDLCETLGVTKQSLQYYFRGNITLAKLGEIAAALNVSPWDLLRPGGVPDPRQPGGSAPAQDQGEAARIICPHCGKAVTLFVDK